MKVMRFRTTKGLTDGDDRPLMSSVSGRSCVFRAGMRWSLLLRGKPVFEIKDEQTGQSRKAQPTSVRLTTIDLVTIGDLTLQANPAWRTQEGAERGIAEVYPAFGRSITVVHFRLI